MAKKPGSEPSEAQVRAYVEAHPEVLAEMNAPERALGGGIVDFQHFLVKNLQAGSKELKSRYELLVEFCRENMSVQTQVHQAALALMRARTLEQLLEVITQDLPALFDVDVVRLAMESETAFTLPEDVDLSGLVLIEPGTVDATMPKNKQVLLVSDAQTNRPYGFDDVFANCETLVRSCALLRLKLESVDYASVLAFGVRHPGRFHGGQGMELLTFLGAVASYQLDEQLKRLEV